MKFNKPNWVILLAFTVSLAFNQEGYAQSKAALSETFVELPDPTDDVKSDWSKVPAGLHL